MISIEKCKEILGESEIRDSEVIQLRESLYAVVDSILDNYLEKFANIEICKKQSSTAESLVQDKALKDTDWKAKSIGAKNTLNRGVMRS